MKNLIIFLFISSTILFGQSNPIVGTDYTVTYDASKNGIFNKNAELTIAYVFDYWGTKPSRENIPEELFENILKPIEGRKNTEQLKNSNGIYSCEISIPDSVALLSYYVTDGSIYDYNNNATYTKLIYGKDGRPVEGARFRNIEFMVMGKSSLDDQIKLLEEELKDYPDYHIDRFVLWQKRFAKQNSLDELKSEKEMAIKYFDNLIEKTPEDWGLYDAYVNSLFSYQSSFYQFLKPELDQISKVTLQLAKKVPEEKRTGRLKSIVDREKRTSEYKKLKTTIIGKPAIDFEFTTIDDKKKKLSDYKGKVVLLDFWGTWCGPCVAEIPNLVKAYKKYNSKGFEIISISSDGFNSRLSKEDFTKFVNEKEMTWAHVLDSKDKRIHNLYKITHWPTMFLVGKDGKVIKNEDVLRGEGLHKTLEDILK